MADLNEMNDRIDALLMSIQQTERMIEFLYQSRREFPVDEDFERRLGYGGIDDDRDEFEHESLPDTQDSEETLPIRLNYDGYLEEDDDDETIVYDVHMGYEADSDDDTVVECWSDSYLTPQ